MPSTHIPVPDKDLGNSPGSLNHSRRSSDDLRRQISRLKSDLEAEKAKVKQANRDKIVEVKRIQENADKEKQKAVESAVRRLHGEHSAELKRQKESIIREKETELRQVLKFKDEEAKALKHQVQEEKERTKRAEDELRRQLIEKSREETADSERKLRNDICVLKDEKHKLEEMYKLKAASDSEKAEIIRRLEAEHEVERHKLIRESKRASAKELQQIRSTARALEEKSQELAFKDQLTRRLEAEKDQLRRRRESGEWDASRRLHSGSFDEEPFEAREDSTYSKRDRERELIKKNADLQAIAHQLEKKCAMLEKHQNNRHESSNSKNHANTEEKIKKLKKRNAELVAIARQLEDKAKKLQDEKTMSQKLSNSTQEVDHVKKMFVKQRAKDLAEHAKILLAKDNELKQIRKQLGVSKASNYSENDKVEELERLIRQSERERLLLEKQIQSPIQSRITSPLHSEEIGDLQQKLGIMEDENENLKTSVKKLEKVEEESIRLSWELKEKSEECKRLLNDLEEKQTKCARLELEREKFVAKCTMLQKKNSEMNKKMKHLEGLEKEIESMKGDLQSAEEMFKTSEAECNKLRSQLENLLQVEQDLRTSEEQRKLLEEEHVATVDILAERDQEIQQLYKIQEEANRAHEMTVTSLDDEIRVLEQKCAESEDKSSKLHEKLEMLKKKPAKANVPTAHKQTQTASGPPSPGSDDTTDEEERARLKNSRVNGVTESSNSGSPQLLSPSVAGLKRRDEPQEEGSDVGKSDNSDILDQVSDRIRQLAASDSTSEEETVSGMGKRATTVDTGPNMPDDGAEDDLTALSRRISMAAMSDNSSSVSASEDNKYDSDTSHNFTGNLGDLEDNQRDSSAPEDEQPEDNEMKRKGKNKKLNHHAAERERSESTSGSEDGSIDEKYLSQEENQTIPEEGGERLAVYIARYSYDPYQHSPNENPEAELAFQAGEYLYVFGEMDEDGFFIAELMNGQRGLVPSNFVERVADESDLPWLANGADDEEDFSDSDEEDGQVVSPLDLLGESDGEQPRKVRMLKFSGRQHMNLRMPLDHFPDVNLGDIEEEEEEYDMRSDNTADDVSREALASQDGLTSDDTDLEPFRVPSPKRLSLDRQFTRSVLLSWKPPPDMSPDDVKGYGVYVNGDLRMMIKGPNKTKALVEDIEPDETYRVSVRTINTRGEESGDREATLTIGRDASLAPSSVNATHVSPTSAKIEWLPGNSSFSHDIFVNDAYQRTIRPGTYQHTLTNLEPDQDYRVTVRARNPKQLTDHEGGRAWEIGDPMASETEFRTDPGGSPEPPLNVQVLESSSSNGLEVTWIPVTITEKGTSNGARVTGYKVYINSVPCAEVTSPLADNVAVVSWMVERAAKKSKGDSLQLTVRTQCVEGESVNSNTVEVSLDMLKFKVSKLLKVKDAVKKPEQPCELVSVKRRDSTEGSLVNGTVVEHDAPEKTENKQNENHKELESKEQVRKDNNQNHVPSLESRTKGKPLVWRADIQDESDYSDSGCSTRVERAWSSDDGRDEEEEEVVEICSPLPAQQTQTNHRQLDEGEEIPCQPLEQNGQELEEGKFENGVQGIAADETVADNKLHLTENTEKLSPSQDSDHSRTRRTDSVSSIGAESSASEFDVEEFDASLKALQSESWKKDPNKTKENSDVVIRPLESDESEVEDDSSEPPLSVIEEEDEDNATGAESQHGTSNRSGSLSEGFRSDDDVMDLLDDEPDSGEFIPALYKPSMITDFPKSDKDLAGIEPLSRSEKTANNDFSLSKYLPVVEQPEDSEPDASAELSHKTVENVQSVGSSQEDQDRNGTFSDTEADHGGLENAQMTSTPLSGSPQHQHRGAYDEDFAEHDAEPVSNAAQEVDDSFRVETDDVTDPRVEPNVTEADRTYTLEDHERTATAGEEPLKVFIALYDYDPSTMSPNPDAEEEELSFREGDLIRIYGDKDDDGFFWGEAHGRQGFVPYNLVSEVQLEDGEELSLPTSPVISPPPGPTLPAEHGVVSSFQQNSEEGLQGDASTSVEESEFEDPRNSANFSLVPKRMVALFDYDPQQLSPNPDNEVELTFKVGDVVYVYGEMDPDGFYTGELRGIRGLVPSNFLEDLTDADDALDVPDTGRTSRTSQDSSQEKIVTLNGTSHLTDETPKKKKGIFAKGKNLFKKITKEKKSRR